MHEYTLLCHTNVTGRNGITIMPKASETRKHFPMCCSYSSQIEVKNDKTQTMKTHILISFMDAGLKEQIWNHTVNETVLNKPAIFFFYISLK